MGRVLDGGDWGEREGYRRRRRGAMLMRAVIGARAMPVLPAVLMGGCLGIFMAVLATPLKGVERGRGIRFVMDLAVLQLAQDRLREGDAQSEYQEKREPATNVHAS